MQLNRELIATIRGRMVRTLSSGSGGYIHYDRYGRLLRQARIVSRGEGKSLDRVMDEVRAEARRASVC